jgi:hypothetical protein
MVPYQSHLLLEGERVKSTAEIRRADEQLGRLAARVSGLWRRASFQRPVHTGRRLSRNAAGPSWASALL